MVDPTESLGFLMNYEEANDLCITSADNIASVSMMKSKKLSYSSSSVNLTWHCFILPESQDFKNVRNESE